MNRSDFHNYQEHAYGHTLQHPGAGLFMDMGLGKTVVALTAADHFLNDACQVARVLVIGPKKVVQSVWRQEAAKWDHLKHLRFSSVLGDEKQRKAGLAAKADIYLINRENVPWLVALSAGRWRWDMIIVDESSSFKNHESKRFRALRSVLPAVKRVLILTGTPMPHTFLDLWSQVYLLDRGKRLGESYYRFRDQYFERDPWSQFTFNLKDSGKNKTNTAEKEISEKIKDICISLSEKDYLKLPERIDRYVEIEFTPAQKKAYDAFERDQVLALPNDNEIAVVNAAALTNKLLQYANGAIYDEAGDWHEVHAEKLDRLEEIIDSAAGHPVLVFYTYKHDLYRIKARLQKAGIETRELRADKDVTDWNEKKIPVLLAHPASAGHGLNLQAGGNIIVWYGLNWALELYQQGNKRIHRQGVKGAVIIHHLLVKGTMDYDVLAVLQGKASNQEALLQAVKARIDKYRKYQKAV